MSEVIINDPAKRNALKEIIRDLHEGSDAAKIKQRFADLIRGISPEELAAIEQELMHEGLSPADIQLVCDVHVAVFEDELKRHKSTRSVPGHPVDTYRKENREAKKRLRRIKAAARSARHGKQLGKFRAALDDLALIELHYQRKENQLFPFLEDAGFDAPSKVMWGKHDEIREEFRNIRNALLEKQYRVLPGLVRSLSRRIRGMIFMEERILFPTAMRKLTDQHWAAVRAGETAIGYAWIRPGNVWDPSVVSAASFRNEQENPIRVPDEGLVDLAVGKLNREQLDLILCNLPVDISFVDENDRVQYYSDTPHRVFPRSPGIIGRDVKNCHPPKSVHIVEEIVTAFKEGRRDKADFWLEMKGRFIYIQYIALRDADGTYRGVLEVGQDATELRTLEGEQRLLNWEDA